MSRSQLLVEVPELDMVGDKAYQMMDYCPICGCYADMSCHHCDEEALEEIDSNDAAAVIAEEEVYDHVVVDTKVTSELEIECSWGFTLRRVNDFEKPK